MICTRTISKKEVRRKSKQRLCMLFGILIAVVIIGIAGFIITRKTSLIVVPIGLLVVMFVSLFACRGVVSEYEYLETINSFCDDDISSCSFVTVDGYRTYEHETTLLMLVFKDGSSITIEKFINHTSNNFASRINITENYIEVW